MFRPAGSTVVEKGGRVQYLAYVRLHTVRFTLAISVNSHVFVTGVYLHINLCELSWWEVLEPVWEVKLIGR